MRYQGRIANWKDDQGFGFVTPVGGGEQAFVHIKAFSARSRRPKEGDLITYELAEDNKRRFQAQNIRFADTRPLPATQPTTRPNAQARKSSFEPFLLILFYSFLAVAGLAGWLPFAVLGLYLLASVIAYLAYALDKSAAQNNSWRTKESTLHFLGIIGGWPGALLAQQTLRHKSKKESFQTVFWATVLLNCVALGWLFTQSGTIFLGGVFRHFGITV